MNEEPLHVNQVKFLNLVLSAIDEVQRIYAYSPNRIDICGGGSKNSPFHCTISTAVDMIHMMLSNNTNTKAPTFRSLLNRILRTKIIEIWDQNILKHRINLNFESWKFIFITY